MSKNKTIDKSWMNLKKNLESISNWQTIIAAIAMVIKTLSQRNGKIIVNMLHVSYILQITHIVKYFGKYACTGKTNHAVVWMRIFFGQNFVKL